MQLLLDNHLLVIILAIVFLSLILSFYTFWSLRKLNTLKEVFFSGAEAKNLESVMHDLTQNQQDLAEEQATTAGQLAMLQEHSTFAIQKLGVVRFNPFNDGGGNFSFSLALLDAHNTGVIITSMYGRQQNRMYTKKITNGTSESPLTEEEEQAIAQAGTKPVDLLIN